MEFLIPKDTQQVLIRVSRLDVQVAAFKGVKTEKLPAELGKQSGRSESQSSREDHIYSSSLVVITISMVAINVNVLIVTIVIMILKKRKDNDMK